MANDGDVTIFDGQNTASEAVVSDGQNQDDNSLLLGEAIGDLKQVVKKIPNSILQDPTKRRAAFRALYRIYDRRYCFEENSRIDSSLLFKDQYPELLDTTTGNHQGEAPSQYFISDYLYNILQLSEAEGISGYSNADQAFTEWLRSAHIVSGTTIDEQALFDRFENDIDELLRTVNIRLELSTGREQESRQAEELETQAGVPTEQIQAIQAAQTEGGGSAPQSWAQKIGTRNARQWEQYYSAWILNEIMASEFYGRYTPEQLQKINPDNFVHLKEMIATRIREHLTSEFTTAQLANLYNADRIRTEVIRKVIEDIHTPGTTRGLTSLYHSITERVKPVVPHKEVVAEHIDSPYEKLAHDLESVNVHHADTAHAQNAAEALLSQYGAHAHEHLTRITEPDLIRHLEAHGVSQEALEQRDAIMAFMSGYIARNQFNQHLNHKSHAQVFNEVSAEYDRLSPQQKIEKVAEVLNRPIDDPEVISLSQEPVVPRQVVDAEMGLIYSHIAPVSPVVTRREKAALVPQFKKEQEQAQNAVAEAALLPGTMAGLLAEVFDDDPGFFEKITKNATDPQKRIEEFATDLGRLTGAKTSEEYVESVKQAAVTAEQLWDEHAEELVAAFYPTMSSAEIAAEVQKGIQPWAYKAHAAQVDPNSTYAAQVHQILEGTKDLASDAEIAWREIRESNQVTEVARHLNPHKTTAELKEILESDRPPIEFIETFSSFDSADQFLKSVEEHRESAHNLWNNSGLSEADQKKLILSERSFGSYDEYRQYIDSGQHLELVAGLLADSQNPQDVLQQARAKQLSSQEVWTTSSQAERRDLAEKVYGTEAADKISRDTTVPPEINTTLAYFGGDVQGVVQANPTVIERAQSVVVAKRLREDSRFSVEVQNVLSSLSPAERNTILRTAPNQGNDTETLTVYVASQLQLGATKNQIQTSLQNSTNYTKAVFETLPDDAQKLILDLYSTDLDPEASAARFVAQHENNSRQTVTTIAQLNSTLSSMSEAEQAALLHHYTGLPLDQAVRKIQDGDYGWVSAITNDGRNLRPLSTPVSTPSVVTAEWMMNPDGRQQTLQNLGITPSSDLVSNPYPPIEVVVNQSLSVSATAAFGVTAVWKGLSVEKKKIFLSQMGLSPREVDEQILLDIPSKGFAEFEKVYLASEGDIEQIHHAIKPEILKRVKRETVEELKKVIGVNVSKLKEDLEVAQADSDTNSKKNDFGTKRLSMKDRQLAVSKVIFETLTDEQQHDLLVALGIPEKKVVEMENGNLEPYNAWVLTVLGQANETEGIISLADQVKNNKLRSALHTFEDIQATNDPTLIVDYFENLSDVDRVHLEETFGSLENAKQSMVATAIYIADPTFVSAEAALLASADGLQAENIQDLLNQWQVNYYYASTPDADAEVINDILRLKKIDEYNAAIADLETSLAQLKQAHLADASLELSVEIAEYQAEIQKYYEMMSHWQGVDGEVPEFLYSDIDPVELAAIEEALLQQQISQAAMQDMQQAGAVRMTRFAQFRNNINQRINNRFNIGPRRKLTAVKRLAKQKVTGKLAKAAGFSKLAGLAGGPVGVAITAGRILASKKGRKIAGAGLAGGGMAIIANPVIGTTLTGAGIGMAVGGPLGALVGGGIGYGIGKAAQWLGVGSNPAVGTAAGSTTGIGGASSATSASTATPTSLANNLTPKLAQGAPQSVSTASTAATQAPVASNAAAATQVPTATAAAAEAATAAASTGTTLSTLAIGVLAPGAFFSLAVMLCIYIILILGGAFLVPLPTDGVVTPDSTTSKYVTIVKIPDPKILTNDHGTSDVTYRIKISPRRGYTLEVQALSDTFSVIEGEGSVVPSIILPDGTPLDPSSPVENPLMTLDTLATTQFKSRQDIEYSVTVEGGTDIFLANTLELTINVLDEGESIATETVSHTANVKIGDPKVLCWPTSGSVSQLPGGSFSHTGLDAYDVIGGLGTPVYSPVNGTITIPPEDVDGYGIYTVISFDYDNNGSEESKLYFGHNPSRSAIANSSGVVWRTGDTVSVGDQIGQQGNTGFSTVPHLHYELRTSLPISLSDLIEDGSSVFVGQQVVSCFGD